MPGRCQKNTLRSGQLYLDVLGQLAEQGQGVAWHGPDRGALPCVPIAGGAATCGVTHLSPAAVPTARNLLKHAGAAAQAAGGLIQRRCRQCSRPGSAWPNAFSSLAFYNCPGGMSQARQAAKGLLKCHCMQRSSRLCMCVQGYNSKQRASSRPCCTQHRGKALPSKGCIANPVVKRCAKALGDCRLVHR